MPVLESGPNLSFWIFIIVVTSLQSWGPSAGAASPDITSGVPPAPVLTVASRSGGLVTLVCQAPRNHRGIRFILYHVNEEVDSSVAPQGSDKAEFTLDTATAASPRQLLYCCLYRNAQSVYSPFSPYLTITQPPSATGAAPTSSPAAHLSPVLSVDPLGGHVRRGEMLSFRCSRPVPTLPPPRPPARPRGGATPLTFVLMKKSLITGDTSMVLQPQASSQTRNATAQLGAFSVGPVKGGDGGSYVCMYQFSKRRQLFNSTFSNAIQVTVTDLLPRPTLTLRQLKDVWQLSCRGSAAYPGSMFSLYQADDARSVATHQAAATSHQTSFSIPAQEEAEQKFECQYTALLGKHWSESERSLPLGVARGIAPTPAGSFSMDWPLVAGSLSAVVLFIAAMALMGFVVQRKVRAAAAEKKKREESEFWSKGQAKDDVPDLGPSHSTYNSNECTTGTEETAPRFSVWNPLSTFSTV